MVRRVSQKVIADALKNEELDFFFSPATTTTNAQRKRKRKRKRKREKSKRNWQKTQHTINKTTRKKPDRSRQREEL